MSISFWRFAGLLVACSVFGARADAAFWKAGLAATNITPTQPLWLAGYGGRLHPSDGKEMELRLKALALEDDSGHRAVIVTTDLLGIPQDIYQDACAALQEKFGLTPEEILLTASHTHCGPVVRKSLMDVYDLDATQRQRVEAYSRELETKLIDTVARAMADLAPARLSSGQGMTTFAVNRRNNPEGKVPKLLEQGDLKGPSDPSVPVLAVWSTNGGLKCVLFGYACHNTVMDYYKWSGDYAGFAQLDLEKSHPETLAMFFMGCGGDQNPLPRRQIVMAERYGGMLAAAVEEVLRKPLHILAPKLKTAMEMVDLQLGAAPTTAELEKLASDKGPDHVAQRWAARLLVQSKTAPLARSYPYPVQAWQLGGDQLLITLGGEPVVDYALQFKSQFGNKIWVAGYCNDVMGYIPSLRVLQEDVPPLAQRGWGYEGARAMLVYGLPAWRWSQHVQDQITAAVGRLVDRIDPGRGIVIETNVPAVMRDGVVLRADIHRPAEGGPYPVLLMRTPYGKQKQHFEKYVRAGYIVVCQDVRGRYASDGVWESWLRPRTHDATDGYDTVQWAAKLPGSNGKVGTIGLSYSAFLQWRLAPLRPPALQAMSAHSIPAHYGDLEEPGTIRPGRRLRWSVVTIAPDLRRRSHRPGPQTESEAAALWDAGDSAKWLQFMPWLKLPGETFEDETPYLLDWLRQPQSDPWKLDQGCRDISVPNLEVVGTTMPKGIWRWRKP
ncbi:MAG TPA: neutral/alkaline non-lysosomal ceramidase N-terminal domain-containing protein [Candidatus Saccharimonadales bacterium]|nr:neutral/alkaline non-lysosomal ceramidase N-terminal domain-containing protein [Candidatus Saccharimonadales bacterium]